MTIFPPASTDARFRNLPDWPYQPKFVRLKGYEQFVVHYIDEGSNGDLHQPTYFLLHGNPTWLYLYRKMIPVFLEQGARVVGMDMIGFGRSAKPEREEVHTTKFHRESLLQFLRFAKLNSNVTLVAQDWGGILGLTLPLEADIGPKIRRLICMNTLLATPEALANISQGFQGWLHYSNSTPALDVGKLMMRAAKIDSKSAAAYNAPFPTEAHQAATRAFPNLVVGCGREFQHLSNEALQWWTSFQGEIFIACGSQDPVFPLKDMQALASQLGTPLLDVKHSGHFTQENGRWVAIQALQYFGDLPRWKMCDIEFLDANVAKITMNNAPVNSMSIAFCAEFCNIVKELERDHCCHSVIVTSGQRAFSAGLDIKTLAYGSYDELFAQFMGLNSVVKALYETPLAVVMAINGPAPAGGAVLSLAADYRIMASNPQGKKPRFIMGLTESKLNMNLTSWLPFHVSRVVGSHKAQKMLEFGDFYTSESALDYGLVDELAELKDIQSRALKIAQKYAKVGQIARSYFKQRLRQEFLQRMDPVNDAHRSARFASEDSIRGVFREMLKRGKKNRSKL